MLLCVCSGQSEFSAMVVKVYWSRLLVIPVILLYAITSPTPWLHFSARSAGDMLCMAKTKIEHLWQNSNLFVFFFCMGRRLMVIHFTSRAKECFWQMVDRV
ncbi:hypothetical protein M758_10G099600 [Ceratodon purpureus]|nr:hypothetical protein M758_10G099600 [Ceratodon purpureus]